MANAFTKSAVKSSLGWSNSFNRDGAFPLDLNSYFGSYEDAAAAALSAEEVGSTNSVYFFGQPVYVFDGTTATEYIIQGDGTLSEVGGTDAMLFVADEAELLALTDINVGQQVFREDTSTIWIYKGVDPSSIDNWVESAAQSDTIWSGTTDKVIFYACTQAVYDAIATKSTTTLYFITDTGRIYRGENELTECIVVTDSIPDVTDAIIGKLYIDSSTFEIKVTFDNSTWTVASPGYLTDGANWASADSGKLATIGLIKAAIEEAVESKIDKVEDAVENNIATFDAEGSIQDSGYSIGGATLADDPSETVLATEAAVAAAVEDAAPIWLSASDGE